MSVGDLVVRVVIGVVVALGLAYLGLMAFLASIDF